MHVTYIFICIFFQICQNELLREFGVLLLAGYSVTVDSKSS